MTSQAITLRHENGGFRGRDAEMHAIVDRWFGGGARGGRYLLVGAGIRGGSWGGGGLLGRHL